jgi:hypothetical protein
MFKLTRRTLAGLTAVAALAGGVGAGAATAPAADAFIGIGGASGPIPPGAFQQPPGGQHAPVCRKWVIPDYFEINHSNGWVVSTAYRVEKYKFWVHGSHHSGASSGGTLKLTRFDTSGRNAQVRFTITWRHGAAGVYTGTIDGDGFLTGTTRDKRNPGSTARFEFHETVDCARWR